MAKKKVKEGKFLSIKNASDLQQIFDGAELVQYEDGIHLVIQQEIPEGFILNTIVPVEETK